MGAELDVIGARNPLVDPSGTKVLLTAPSFGDMSAGRIHANVEIHDLADGHAITTVALTDDRVDALAQTSDGSTIMAASTTWPPAGQQRLSNLVAIDAVDGRVTFSVPLDSAATAIALSPDGSRVYLTDRASSLLVLDRATGARVATVLLGGVGSAVAVAPDGRAVHVVGTTGLKTIDTASNTVTKTLGLRDDPTDIALTPDGRTGVVTTSADDNAVGVDLDSGHVDWTVAVGDRPVGVAVTPDGLQALVANADSSDVTVVDLATRTTGRVPTASPADGITLSPNGDFGFIDTGDRVVRFDRGVGSRPAHSTRTPSPGPPALIVEPAVPGWNTVRSVRRAVVYDVPPEWTVDPEGTIVGFGSEDGKPLGKPLVAGSGSARTGRGTCGDDTSPTVSATTQTDDVDLAEAADIVAENWAHAAQVADGPPAERRKDPPRTVTTVTGRPAVLIKIAATTAPPPGNCGSDGAVYALAATGFTGELGPTVVLVIVTRPGPYDDVPEDEIRRILTTLRPER